MIKLRHVLEGIFLVVATWYMISGASYLMTYPNDLTFLAGLLIITLAIWVWVEIIYIRVRKSIDSHKENNEN